MPQVEPGKRVPELGDHCRQGRQRLRSQQGQCIPAARFTFGSFAAHQTTHPRLCQRPAGRPRQRPALPRTGAAGRGQRVRIVPEPRIPIQGPNKQGGFVQAGSGGCHGGGSRTGIEDPGLWDGKFTSSASCPQGLWLVRQGHGPGNQTASASTRCRDGRIEDSRCPRSRQLWAVVGHARGRARLSGGCHLRIETTQLTDRRSSRGSSDRVVGSFQVFGIASRASSEESWGARLQPTGPLPQPPTHRESDHPHTSSRSQAIGRSLRQAQAIQDQSEFVGPGTPMGGPVRGSPARLRQAVHGQGGGCGCDRRRAQIR